MKNRQITNCVALMFCGWLLIVPGQAVAQNESAKPEVERARSAIEAFLEKSGDYGFGVAVWANGEVAWSQQWGPRNKQASLPVTPETMFRIGSVSKLITAMTLASMVEQKQIDWDVDIRRYVPDLPKSFSAMTPRILAGHLSGIRHYDPKKMQQEFLSGTAYSDQTDALQIFINDPLKSEPGAAYLYSTYGYTMLGASMENAGEKPLITLMRKHVFNPAGMQHSFGEHVETVDGELAIPYAVMRGRELTVPPINNSGKLAGGGIVSTPIDLARFLGAVAEHRLVAASSLKTVLDSQKTEAGELTNVGIGWRVATDDQGRRYIHHGGSAAGGRCFVLLYPKSGVGVAMCMNLSSDEVSFAEDLALRVVSGFLPNDAAENSSR